ncbi:MAG: hypothetical protein LBM62_09495 [Mediterranea sp.]|jgi:hypothetical protein|nr:hypothetical protein [Mediterranea sp.]
MKTQERKLLADKIVAAIPPNQNVVPYLMSILGIARESIYRRIRGEVPFTMDEMEILARELNLSIDEMLGGNVGRKLIFQLGSDITASAEETFINMYKLLYGAPIFSESTEQREILISLNKLYPVFYPGNKALFKFFYYEWVHQIQDAPLDFRYSDIEVPFNVLDMHDRVRWDVLYNSDITLISERDMVVNTLRKLSYLYKMRLITLDELHEIKRDIENIINELEVLLAKGVHKNGSFNFYLSEFNIPQNSIYVSVGQETSSFFWIDPANMMFTSDTHLCKMHRRWLHSLKKFSSSIASSNQAMRADFFANQRNRLEQIGNE